MRAERARVFFALWPDAPVRDALSQAGAVAQAECGGKATPSDKIHLTLVFIGDVERSSIAALRECADRVEAEPFELPQSADANGLVECVATGSADQPLHIRAAH